jgi:hypothetical protein
MAHATGWRIFASLCATLGTEKTPKSLLSERFLGQNQRSNRQNGEKARRRKGLRRVYRCYRSVALWRILSTPPPTQDFAEIPEIRPARRPLPPSIHRQGFPRSHGPAKDIVNHQRVNAWLMPLRATAAGPTKKFAGISGADEAMAERVDQSPMRQVAHFCVTLRHSGGRKDAENAAFRPLFGRKSAVESAKWRKSPPAPRLAPSLQMLQKCSIVAHQCPDCPPPENSLRRLGNSAKIRKFTAPRPEIVR